MGKSVSVSTTHLKYLIPGFKLRIAEIEAELGILQKEMEELNGLISMAQISNTGNMTTSSLTTETIEQTHPPFNKEWSWFEKAKFILKKELRPLSTAEITNQVVKFQPELNRLKALRVISSVLGTKSNDGKEIKRILIPGEDQKFALK